MTAAIIFQLYTQEMLVRQKEMETTAHVLKDQTEGNISQQPYMKQYRTGQQTKNYNYTETHINRQFERHGHGYNDYEHSLLGSKLELGCSQNSKFRLDRG